MEFSENPDLESLCIERLVETVSLEMEEEEEEEEEEGDCIICFERLGTQATETLHGCNHTFHESCFSDWKKNGWDYCPLCRSPLD